MNRSCTFALALVAAGFSTSGYAGKPAAPKCSPQLLAPTGLTVESDGTTITSTWNEVNDIAKEATKYSVEVTAHYDGHGDVKFGFTAADADPGVVDTASLAISASSLDTTVCSDPPFCTSTTTYSATSVTVQVKGLNPPSKGKNVSQCNPLSAPVTASVAPPPPACPCFDAADLAFIASTAASFPYCRAHDDQVGADITWEASGSEGQALARDLETYQLGGGRVCRLSMGDVTATLSVAEFNACTSLIEAAQAELGCTECFGDNCP